MKEIKAILQPFMIQKVIDALQEIPDLPGVTVSDVRGFGQSHGLQISEQSQPAGVGYVHKAKMEIVVNDDQLEEVLAVIVKNGHTGNIGDGKIFISNVDEVIRIRTGERGSSAV